MADLVHIKSGGTGYGTVVTCAGQKIHGVVRATIQINVNQPNRCDLELLAVALEADALATYHVINPSTGLAKAIRKIEFADGTVWPIAAAETEAR